MTEIEPGNDEMLPNDFDPQPALDAASAASQAEDERLANEPEAVNEPGDDFPEPEPAGLDADTGYNPLPPA
jgi:hypothetical protein